ncbi:MAG: TIGR00454 family protein [Methanosarcinales archaeon]|nr:MAG: TIGR00454 family protein [Methanosarcinales archaeon]
MDALVMAGGPGNRLGKGEKPLISLCGKPMISYVLDALHQSDGVDKIFVATSPHTLETRKYLENMRIEVVETKGIGYVSDLVEATEILGLRTPFLVVMSDLPLLSAKLIDEIIDVYWKINKPALSVYVPISVCKDASIRPSTVLNIDEELIVPAGVNILDGGLIKEGQEEHRLVLKYQELAVNVNTIDDLRICKQLLHL